MCLPSLSQLPIFTFFSPSSNCFDVQLLISRAFLAKFLHQAPWYLNVFTPYQKILKFKIVFATDPVTKIASIILYTMKSLSWWTRDSMQFCINVDKICLLLSFFRCHFVPIYTCYSYSWELCYSIGTLASSRVLLILLCPQVPSSSISLHASLSLFVIYF